ncbi:hypothetical protein GBAR_LOCUS26247, partial [Geodia barretti]
VSLSLEELTFDLCSDGEYSFEVSTSPIPITTHDVQRATVSSVRDDSEIIVTAEFLKNTTARGCFVVLQSGNESTADVFRVLLRPGPNTTLLTSTISDTPSSTYRALFYDLEEDGLPNRSPAYQPNNVITVNRNDLVVQMRCGFKEGIEGASCVLVYREHGNKTLVVEEYPLNTVFPVILTVDGDQYTFAVFGKSSFDLEERPIVTELSELVPQHTQTEVITSDEEGIMDTQVVANIHRYGTSRCYDMSHSSVGANGGSQTVPRPQEEAICRYIGWVWCVTVCHVNSPPAPVAVYDEVVLPLTTTSSIPTEPSHTTTIPTTGNVAYETTTPINTAHNSNPTRELCSSWRVTPDVDDDGLVIEEPPSPEGPDVTYQLRADNRYSFMVSLSIFTTTNDVQSAAAATTKGTNNEITFTGEFIESTTAQGCFVVLECEYGNPDVFRALLLPDDSSTSVQNHIADAESQFLNNGSLYWNETAVKMNSVLVLLVVVRQCHTHRKKQSAVPVAVYDEVVPTPTTTSSIPTEPSHTTTIPTTGNVAYETTTPINTAHNCSCIPPPVLAIESSTVILEPDGPDSLVGDLSDTNNASSVTISWSAPFSLDVTGVDPDIWYSVLIYNVTDENNPTAILCTDCINITETHYTFTPECFNKYNISVVPINGAGQGETSGMVPVIETHIEALSRSECRVTLSSSEEFSGLCNFNISLDGMYTCHSFPQEPHSLGGELAICDLAADTEYSLPLTLFYDAGGMTTIVINFTTFDVQNATVNAASNGIVVTVNFIANTTATGCFTVLQSEDGSPDEFRALSRPESETTLVATIDNVPPSTYTALFYDLEQDGLPNSNVAYVGSQITVAGAGNVWCSYSYAYLFIPYYSY